MLTLVKKKPIGNPTFTLVIMLEYQNLTRFLQKATQVANTDLTSSERLLKILFDHPSDAPNQPTRDVSWKMFSRRLLEDLQRMFYRYYVG